MITWLASYPRSGNALCRRILHGHFGLASHSVYEEAPASPLKPYIAPAGPSLAEMARSDRWFWVKTHQPPDEESHPALCIVRDGRDAIVSYTWMVLRGDQADSPEEVRARFPTTMRDLIVGASPFLTWSENVLAWRRRRRTAWVRFEDMIVRPAETVEQALGALGVPFARRARPEWLAFSALQKQSPKTFRQGKPGAWRDEMPPELEALFWERHGHAMQAFGYPR